MILHCFAIGFLLDIVVALPVLGQIARGGLFNPDSYMRLVRLREILAAHTALHGVARDGSGAGTVLPWSHLLDSLLLLGAAPLSAIMEQDEALRWAGVALGPLGTGGLCAALCWAFAPLTDREWRWTTAVLAAISPPIVGYGVPGVVHHHILLAVACVMTAGWAARAPLRGGLAGWQAGVWAACGLWLSPETMPCVVMVFGGLGIAWLTQNGGQAARGLRAGGTALLLLVSLIVAVDPPAGGVLAPQIDRVSIVYATMALAWAALGWLLCVLDRQPWPRRRRKVLGTALAVLLLGGWLACFPRLLLGPEGLLDPEQTRAMLGVIAEMQPVTGPGDGLALLATGALGAAVVAAIAWRRHSAVWIYAALCAVAIVTLGALHRRFSTYGAVLGAGLLPVALTLSARRLAGQPPLLRAADRLALLALFLLPPVLGALPQPAAAGGPRPSCALGAAVGLLAPYAGQVVLADVGDSPELLYRTGVLTVGSLYHSNPAAYMRLRAAWRSTALAQVPAALRATGAAAILVCPGAARSRLIADLPPGTLLDRLDRGDPPGWLQRAGSDVAGHVLYRIEPPPDR